MKNKDSLLCYLGALLCAVFLAAHANLTTRTAKFQKVLMPEYVTQMYPVSLNASSLIDCSRKCVSKKQTCFVFEKKIRLCKIGNCLKNNSGNVPLRYVFVDVTCDTNGGFKLVKIGSITACLWISNNQLDYINSRDACKAKGAYLYTVKSVKKLEMLQFNYNKISDAWIGLDDLVTEGAYKWVDDSTICDTTCQLPVFRSGEPNNDRSHEDCGAYKPEFQTLNDFVCNMTLNYVCEKPFFNFP